MFPRTSWNASANVSSVTINDGLLVLGVDPGLADTGYGAVRRLNGRLTMVTCGTLKTPANLSEPKRLAILAAQLRALIAELLTRPLFDATDGAILFAGGTVASEREAAQ